VVRGTQVNGGTPPVGVKVQLRSHVANYAIPVGTVGKVVGLFRRNTSGGLMPTTVGAEYVQLEIEIESAPSDYVWTPVADFWNIWSAHILSGGINRWNHLMGGS